MTFQIFIAHLRFQIYRHGWFAAAGLLILNAAIGLYWFGVQTAQVRTAALRAQLATQHESSRTQIPRADEVAKQRQLAFYSTLPDSSGALHAVDLIHRAASANSVQLTTGEYRVARDAHGQLLRYQVTLPAQSNYPSLRAWLADVMNTVPNAALDDISFQRDSVGSDLVDARVRLTLFLRAP